MDENYLPAGTGAAVAGDRMLRLLFSDGTVEQAKVHPLTAARP
jgi:hypothetical protein